ncbi:DNA-cytosine methyltransferase [Stanieria cyanosphaera PCC 7437]|uniref:Cytosine-specific methyltransferase n=1 Tax=Stanieria cyanosphaera (strain ATCC 29371 / PCC 7437) TaxID=111780 RepID=K9XRC7_STAC7|nr:DNA (cytosine-5-)-methyltransferase [Stanieria cyanosphaera]AFZ34601.1 DNA-cytosine methyltransferase [Stanieria cyanosphaera PCC 7437]
MNVIQYNLFEHNNFNYLYINNEYFIERSLKFIDLFAGIGGMRIALEKIGASCVFSSEWDKYAQKTYQANFGEVPHGDITKITTEIIPDFDILVAGFPCQPFSSIGKREGFQHPTQGTLFYEIIRILIAKQPIAFLLENVEGLIYHDKKKTLETIIKSLNDLNYDVFYQVLDAAHYGVPQHRKRVYFVGFNRNYSAQTINFYFPPAKKNKVEIGQFVESHFDGYCISEHLQKTYLFKKDDGRPELIDRNSKGCVKTLVSTYHKIQRLTGTFVKDGKTGIRLLSENECKAIMGFDRDFIIPVSRTQMYRQLGNSVAIPVVEAIAKEMVKTIYFIKLTIKMS